MRNEISKDGRDSYLEPLLKGYQAIMRPNVPFAAIDSYHFISFCMLLGHMPTITLDEAFATFKKDDIYIKGFGGVTYSDYS
jgi:hypothetical protein